ncbi:MAG: tetratricopeptide repeat protein [Planctomycetes bacterium]|nr:tetratricopeptide repeat protein [Planctomycetota bacterium]
MLKRHTALGLVMATGAFCAAGLARAQEDSQALSADAHLVLGIDCFKDKKYDEAIVEFRIAANARPADGSILHYLGAAYYEKGSYDESLIQFKEGLALAPAFGDEFSFYYVARLYYRNRLYCGARGWFTRIIEQNPNSKFSGEARRFVAEIDALLATPAENATIDWYYDRGLTESQNRRHLIAEDYFREVLALGERRPAAPRWRSNESRYYLAHLLNKRDACAEALALLDKVDSEALTVSRSAVTPADVTYQRGFALARLDRWDEARKALVQVITEIPNHAFAHYQLGRVEWATGRYDTAIVHLTEAQMLERSLGVGCDYYLGCCHMQRGETAAAKSRFESVIRLCPTDEIGRQARQHLNQLATPVEKHP